MRTQQSRARLCVGRCPRRRRAVVHGFWSPCQPGLAPGAASRGGPGRRGGSDGRGGRPPSLPAARRACCSCTRAPSGAASPVPPGSCCSKPLTGASLIPEKLFSSARCFQSSNPGVPQGGIWAAFGRNQLCRLCPQRCLLVFWKCRPPRGPFRAEASVGWLLDSLGGEALPWARCLLEAADL